MTWKSSTLEDLEGHWQPVRSAILATAGLSGLLVVICAVCIFFLQLHCVNWRWMVSVHGLIERYDVRPLHRHHQHHVRLLITLIKMQNMHNLVNSVWIAGRWKGWTPPNCFLNPHNTLSNYVQGGQLYRVRQKILPPRGFLIIFFETAEDF